MYLQNITLKNWRNLTYSRLDASAGINVLYGPNGSGKTNLLEGIGILALWRSFRGSPLCELIQWGKEQAIVTGHVRNNWAETTVSITIRNGGRLVTLDGVPQRDPTKYSRFFRAVAFTPEDAGMVYGEPESRRRFLDRATFNCWPSHMTRVVELRRILLQRATLLRSGKASRTEIETWNEKLVETGIQVIFARLKVVEAMNNVLDNIHKMLTGGIGASIRYRSSIACEEKDLSTLRRCFYEKLSILESEEKRRGMNLVGPHRDDLLILFNAGSSKNEYKLAKSFGSQGQVRTLALALKLAELEVASVESETPVLIIDDLSSEIDRTRLRLLMNYLLSLRGQVFVSTTDMEAVKENLGEAGACFQIIEGRLSEDASCG